jgi:HKD family nuclease
LSVKKLSTLLIGAVTIVLVATTWGSGTAALAADGGTQGTKKTGPAVPVQQQLDQIAQTTPSKLPGGGNGGSKKGYRAPQGPFFNNPRGGKAQYNIERQVIAAINHTRKGETIRIAVYSFDRIQVADAIIRAHKRGVKVQMLLNDHQDTKAMKMMRAVLGTNRWGKSFIYKCKAGCRSTNDEYRNMHEKLYLFSQSGRTKDVIATGSANMMMNAIRHQWNDLYFTSGNPALYDQFVTVFNDMKHDYDVKQPTLFFCGVPKAGTCDDSVDKHTVQIFPRKSTSSDDPVLTVLNKIQCIQADGTRTKLALSMHTMRGARGNYIASAIRNKWAEGCDFRVDYGLIGYQTKQILGASTSRGRIPLRSTGFDYNTDDNFDLNHDGDDDLILDRYSHQKYFIIDGTYNGHANTHMVFTGSSNWASLGTAEDEIFMSIRGGSVMRKYLKNFDFEWNGAGNSRNAYTTTYANFKTAAGTKRMKITTVEPDPYKPGGKYWEND